MISDTAFDNRQAELDARDEWIAAGSPEPDDADIPEDVRAMIPAPMAVAIAHRAQRVMSGLIVYGYESTKVNAAAEFRRAYADAVAEAETGATRADVNMLNRYPRCVLSLATIEGAIAYGMAYRRTLEELPMPTDYLDLLVAFEEIAGVRRRVDSAA